MIVEKYQLGPRCKNGKRSYVLRSEAKESAKSLANSGVKLKNGRVYTYLCDECGHYHLTSMHPDQAKTVKKQRG